MDREGVIGELEKSLKWEDEFVLDYDTDTVMELIKTLGKSKSERILKLLRENISDTERHRSILKGIIEKARRGEYEL